MNQIDQIDEIHETDQKDETNQTDQKDEIDRIDEIMHPKQKDIFQSMTPEQKLKIAAKLYHFARQLKAASLRAQNADWTEEKVHNKLREIFLYART
jgi:acetyl-CoA carboxylase alpha subunit